MPDLTNSIPTLTQGVSQQAQKQRREVFAEEQTNALSDPTLGLTKRPGTSHLAAVAGRGAPAAKYHWIDRAGGERYVLVIQKQVIKAFTAQGEEVFVRNGSNAYLDCEDERTEIKAFTESDTTFLVNRTKTVAMSSATSPALAHRAVIEIRSGNYNSTYGVRITPSGGSASEASIDTDDGIADETVANTNSIASLLAAQIDAIPNTTVLSSTNESTIVVDMPSAFAIEGFDSTANTAVAAAKDSVPAFDDLPGKAPDGFTVKVAGLDGDAADDYWVRFNANNNSYFASEGVWEETVAPSTETSLDAATMPITVTRKQDTDGSITGTANAIYFDVAAVAWGTRSAGDSESNGSPSFVGSTIENVSLYRNRLVFLSGSNVILSRTDDLFQLFRTTVRSLPDDERIDVRLTPAESDTLRYAVSTAGELLVIGANAQLSVPGDAPTTPVGFRVEQSAVLQMQTDTAPVVSGRSVLLPVYSGEDNSGVLEYRANSDLRLNDASPLTLAIPRYIEGPIRHLATATEPSMLFVTAENEPGTLYVLRWVDFENQRVQAAWSKWTFDTDRILSFNVFDGTLTLLLKREDDLYFESVALDPEAKPAGYPVPIRLDRLITSVTPVPEPEATSGSPIIPNNVGGGPSMLTSDNALRLTGNWTLSRPDASGGDSLLGATDSYTVTTTTDFTHVANPTWTSDSSVDSWIAANGTPDIFFQGALRVRVTQTVSGGTPVVTDRNYSEVLIMAIAASGKYIVSLNESGGTWESPKSLLWYSGGVTRDVQANPLALPPNSYDAMVVVDNIDDGFFAIAPDDARVLADGSTYRVLDELDQTGGTIAANNPAYIPAGDPASEEPATSLMSVVTLEVL